MGSDTQALVRLSTLGTLEVSNLMNNSTALGAIRRRWWVIILLAGIGAALGALPQPARVEQQSKLTRYTATHTLLVNNTDALQGAGTAISPNQVPLLATTGEVPKRVAEKIQFAGNSALLASQVTVAFDPQTGALTVVTTQDSAPQAELVANTFADVLNSYLAERQDIVYQGRLAASSTRLDVLKKHLEDLSSQLALAKGDPILTAQVDAVSRQYSVAFEQNQLLTSSPPVLAFTTLQRAEAVPLVQAGGGLSAPRSRTTRGLLGLVTGLAVGVGVALLLGLLDRRIRTREQAEAIMGMRARVLIPRVKTDRRSLVVTNGRHDTLSDSYRTLRNVVDFIQGSLEPVDRARITVVVSPGPAEGKTSMAANLAAAMVETGQHTIVVNTDFRRPRLSGFVAEGPIVLLPIELEDVDSLDPRLLLADTVEPNLALLDLSTLNASAGELVRATAHVLPKLAESADAIVVDTSPVGATAEVLEMVPLADVIVVVVRIGSTSISTAVRTIAILRDLTTAPMVLVLTGLKPERNTYYEYADRRPVERGVIPSGARAARRTTWRRHREKVG